MAFNLAHCQRLTAEYEKLSPDAKSVMDLLSLFYTPVSYSILLDGLENCKIVKNSGNNFTRADLNLLVQELQKKNLVVQASGKGIGCHQDVAEVITRKMVQRGNFKRFAEGVMKSLHETELRWQFGFASGDILMRRMRLAFYSGKAELFWNLARQHWDYYYDFKVASSPITRIVGCPFDMAFMMTVPAVLADRLLDMLFACHIYGMEKIPELYEFFEQTCLKPSGEKQAKGGQTYWYYYLMLLIMRGQVQDAQALAKHVPSIIERKFILGISALLLGDAQGSATYFDEALMEYKAVTKKRKACIKSIDSLFYLLALIKQNTPESLRKASEYLAVLEKAKGVMFADNLVHFRALVTTQMGLPVSPYFANRSKRGLLFLLCEIADYSVSPNLIESEVTGLMCFSDAATALGFEWMAGEAAELIIRISKNDKKCEKYRLCAAAMRKKNGLVSLADLVTREEPWERTLKALVMLPSEKKETNSADTSRLIWRLRMGYGGCGLHPCIQKKSAAGNWSRGQSVALKRLYQERDSLQFLTPQDKAICSHLKLETGRSSYYSYSGEAYVFGAGAFLALVGHPLVFMEDAPTSQVEVAKGEVALRVSKKGDSIIVEVTPHFCDKDAVAIVKESYSRVVVYEITEQQRHLAKVLEKGLQVPAHAEDRIAEVLGNVASCITVQSDISNVAVQLPEVSADAQPEVLLLPYEEGLRAQLMVRPLEKGSYYFPGEGGEVVLAEMEGKRVQARRNFEEERCCANRVIEGCPTLTRISPVANEWLIPEPDSALELLVELQAMGEQVRVSWPKGEKMRVTRNASAGDFCISITSGMDWFSLKGKLHLDESLVLDMRQLLEHVASSSSRFVPLGDGQFLALTRTFQKRLEELRLYAEEHGDSLRFHPLATSVLEEFSEEAGNLRADKKWKQHLEHLGDVQKFVPVLPETLRVELRDYQKEGFQWLARLAHWGVGACLADDMGLGKTVEALALLVSRAAEGPSLVVAPTSVCANWIDEARRFAPTLNVYRFGDGDRKSMLDSVTSFDLVVCSYGLMQQEEDLLTAVPWNVIVLDEAQAIKNRTTKRSKVSMKLQGGFKLITTGTPIENHLGELWNLFRFINPGLLGSFERFNNRFAVPIERDQNRETRMRLKRLIQPFVLRRVKEQVLEELPSRTEITLRVELSKDEAAFYEALRQEAVAALEGDGESAGQKHLRILAQIMKLRRACCNTSLVSPDISLPSAKLEVFGAIVEELLENRHKALVFSQFVDHLTLIRKFLDEKQIRYQYLDGSTPAPQRKKCVDAFQSGEGDLFLISLKAGGLGLNLTAADYVIHMDPWWNPAVEDQASDRSHRIGQERPVTIYRLVAQDTIEEKIVSLHQKKRGLADSLLEGSDMAGKMNTEELMALLRESSTMQAG